MKNYNAKESWNKVYGNKENRKMAYPSEYVIRILKGGFPKLNLDKSKFLNSKFCDSGCGDGRNLMLAKECGFDISGVEITSDIVDNVKMNLNDVGIKDHDIRVGSNDNCPFDDNYFDYLLSWNSCYYMGDKGKAFDSYVDEFARILKKNGYMIMSIPKKTAFIYKDAILQDDGYCVIKNDFFNTRNGEIFRIFDNEKEIEETFSGKFKNFIHASIHDDCFGLEYHWHLVICQKK